MFNFSKSKSINNRMIKRLINSPKLKFLYTLLLFQVVLFAVYRLFFLWYFNDNVLEGTYYQIAQNLFLGSRFDLRLSLILLIPAIMIINFPLNPAFKVRFVNFIYTLLFGLITFLYIIDVGYFSYLKSRLNATILHFLNDSTISARMILESYPWVKLIILTLFLGVLIHVYLTNFISKKLYSSIDFNYNKSNLAGSFFFLLFFIFGIYGSPTMYPLRWSQAFSTPDIFASNLSLNPVLYVFDTYSFRNKDFDEKRVADNYELIANYLKVKNPNLGQLNFMRHYSGDKLKNSPRPNIVLIVMESLAWYKTGLGGSELNPTPHLDAIAQESLLFSQFYTPTVATARSIFSIVTGLPDVSKVKTSSRNPFIVNQHTIMGQFEEYQKYYFLGGSANWGNIRGVFSYNVPSLKIFEEGSYKSPRMDVWGISDLDLFKESAEIINQDYKKQKKPFFAFIQTSGFHRPYTIAPNSDNFVKLEPKDVSPTKIKAFGFESYEELNSMRLQDFALGKFIRLAKNQAWYNNTIFVIIGDHALPHNNALNVPEWKRSLLNNYHVPLLIHFPKLIKPNRENKIASSLDVMPTLAGLAGITYSTRSLGRDLFNTEFDNYRAAFSYNWYSPFQFSLIDDEFYFEYNPASKIGKLNKYKESDKDIDVKNLYPEKYLEMEKLTKGLYESSRYLLHNNQRMENSIELKIPSLTKKNEVKKVQSLL